jgi:hypothetical protein
MERYWVRAALGKWMYVVGRAWLSDDLHEDGHMKGRNRRINYHKFNLTHFN